MIMKLILLAAVVYGIYILFFRNGNIVDKMREKRSGTSPKKEEKDVDTVVECAKCGLYVSVDEAILKDGKYYCSKACAEVK